MIVVQEILPDRLALKQTASRSISSSSGSGSGAGVGSGSGSGKGAGSGSGTGTGIGVPLPQGAPSAHPCPQRTASPVPRVPDPSIKSLHLFFEPGNMERRLAVLCNRCLNLRRKAFCLRTQPRDMPLDDINGTTRLPPCIMCRNTGNRNARYDEDEGEQCHHICHHG